jgi:uncharacterized protein
VAEASLLRHLLGIARGPWRLGAVCFAVADCDAAVARARELGATITIEPMDTPIGRFAAVIDPQGASFTLMQPAPSD